MYLSILQALVANCISTNKDQSHSALVQNVTDCSDCDRRGQNFTQVNNGLENIPGSEIANIKR